MASSEEVLVWTPELEVSLFHSMKGHKPVGKTVFCILCLLFLVEFFLEFLHCFSGINRHFHMACIHDKFATSTGKRNISSKQIWEHLQELYNLQALVSGWALKNLISSFVFCGSRENFPNSPITFVNLMKFFAFLPKVLLFAWQKKALVYCSY